MRAQDNAIRSLFSSNTDHEYDVISLTTFFLFFYGLSILTIGINVPSGLFVPCILCGATYGRLAVRPPPAPAPTLPPPPPHCGQSVRCCAATPD